MLNRIVAVQVSDTTKADSSNVACKINLNIRQKTCTLLRNTYEEQISNSNQPVILKRS